MTTSALRSARFSPHYPSAPAHGRALPTSDGKSGVEILEATGDPHHLAQAAADWFENLLVRPLERRDWLLNGHVFHEYAFSDNGTPLIGRNAWRPPHLFGAPPDRVIRIRGADV